MMWVIAGLLFVFLYLLYFKYLKSNKTINKE